MRTEEVLHKTPLSLGGTHDRENLIALCDEYKMDRKIMQAGLAEKPEKRNKYSGKSSILQLSFSIVE